MFKTRTVIDTNVARTVTPMFFLRAKLLEPFRSDLASFAICLVGDLVVCACVVWLARTVRWDGMGREASARTMLRGHRIEMVSETKERCKLHPLTRSIGGTE